MERENPPIIQAIEITVIKNPLLNAAAEYKYVCFCGPSGVLQIEIRHSNGWFQCAAWSKWLVENSLTTVYELGRTMRKD